MLPIGEETPNAKWVRGAAPGSLILVGEVGLGPKAIPHMVRNGSSHHAPPILWTSPHYLRPRLPTWLANSGANTNRRPGSMCNAGQQIADMTRSTS